MRINPNSYVHPDILYRNVYRTFSRNEREVKIMHDYMGKEEHSNTTFFFGQMQKIVMFNWHLMALIRTFITEVFGI